MIAKLWRIPGTDQFGLAIGYDMVEVFWAIDEHVNPYQVQLKSVRHLGMALPITRSDPDPGEGVRDMTAALTVSDLGEDFYDAIDTISGWKVPAWDTYDLFGN